STLGTIEHFWSVGFKQGDGAEGFLPPRRGAAFFLNVMDGGFVNRTGRVTSFSLFVNDAPGSSSGTTYVTDHSPMPQPLIEGGEVSCTREAWPNPVAGHTTFEFTVGSDAARAGFGVTLAIHDLQGRVVKTLHRGATSLGVQRVDWNATNDSGQQVGSGVYYAK